MNPIEKIELGKKTWWARQGKRDSRPTIYTPVGPHLGLLTSKSNGVQRNVAHTHTDKNQNQQMTSVQEFVDGWGTDESHHHMTDGILASVSLYWHVLRVARKRQQHDSSSTEIFSVLPLRFCDCFSVEGFRSKLRCTCPFEYVPLETLDHLLFLYQTKEKKTNKLFK